MHCIAFVLLDFVVLQQLLPAAAAFMSNYRLDSNLCLWDASEATPLYRVNCNATH